MAEFSFNPKLSDELALWGEITEPDPKKFKCDIPEDKYEENIKIASKPESPKAKLPVKDMSGPMPKIRVSPELYEIDPLIKHTIQLNQFTRTVTNLLNAISTSKQYPKCPEIPQVLLQPKQELGGYFKPKLEPNEAESFDNNVLELCYERPKFELGQAERFQSLEKASVLELLKRSVLVVLAHSGFDRATKSSMDVLVDALRMFLIKLGKILHSFSQKDIRRGRFAEKDKLEKALLNIGLGGIGALEEYWQKDVIEKRDKALQRAENLSATYDGLFCKLVKKEETPEAKQEKPLSDKPPLFTHPQPFTLLDFDADLAHQLSMAPTHQFAIPHPSPSFIDQASTSFMQADEPSTFSG